MHGAIGQDTNEARSAAVDLLPVVHGGTAESGGVSDGGDMEEEIGAAAKGRVDGHGIANGGIGEHVAGAQAGALHLRDAARGLTRDVEPDFLTARRERTVRRREAERFGYHLRSRRRSQELTTSARRGARPATHVGGFLQRDAAMRKTCAHRLHGTGVFAGDRREHDPAGHEHAREIVHGGEGHHHGRQPFVAGGYADDALPHRQAANEPANNGGGVIAIGQRVKHARGALSAPVAGIAHVAGERHRAEPAQFLRGGAHLKGDLPVPGVIAERDRLAAFPAQPALSAENEIGGARHFLCAPAHAGILTPAEEVAAGSITQHFLRERQAAGRAGGFGADGENGVVAGKEG